MHSGQHDDREQPAAGSMDAVDGAEEQPLSSGRPRRSAYKNGDSQQPRGRQHIAGYNSVDDMEEESDATSSGGEWEGGDDNDVDDNTAEDEDDADVDISEDNASIADEEESVDGCGPTCSLVVSLRYQKNQAPSVSSATPGGGGRPRDISALQPVPPHRQEPSAIKSRAAIDIGSPAPLITNIHAAVAEPLANTSTQAAPIANEKPLDHEAFTQTKQENAPTLS